MILLILSLAVHGLVADIQRCTESADCTNGQCMLDKDAGFNRCFCKPGYYGALCEKKYCQHFCHLDECSQEVEMTYDCMCPSQDWGNTTCLMDTCTDVRCQSSKKCVISPKNHQSQCICKNPLRYGTKCDRRCSEHCHHGQPCSDSEFWEGMEQPKCICGYPYTGKSCEFEVVKCAQLNSLNNNSFFNVCDITNTYECLSDENGAIQCNCRVGSTGDRCETQAGCSDDTCHNGGTCSWHASSNGYVCACPEGFWGRFCEISEPQNARVQKEERLLVKRNCLGGKPCQPTSNIRCNSSSSSMFCDNSQHLQPYALCPFPHYCAARFGNGVCDWECATSGCLNDGFDCKAQAKCDPACRNKFADGVCNLECAGPECNYDAGDCNGAGLSDVYKPDLTDGDWIVIELNISDEEFLARKNAIMADISRAMRTIVLYEEIVRDEGAVVGAKRATNPTRRAIRMPRVKRVAEHRWRDGRNAKIRVRVLRERCPAGKECARDLWTLGNILGMSSDKNIIDSDSSLSVLSMQFFPKGSSSFISVWMFGIVSLIVFVIAVTLVVVRTHVVTAVIWTPPKDEAGEPTLSSSSSNAAAPVPVSSPTPLHEQAYSNETIDKPISPISQLFAMDDQGRTPLFWLIASSKRKDALLEDLDEMARHGANLNHQDHDGYTPLSIAIICVRPSLCIRLVQWGANPAASTHAGASCLHLAVAQDDFRCVEWLLSFEVVCSNINEVDESDRSPLALAAQGGSESARIAAVLIDSGADVLSQGDQASMWRYSGRAPLHWAAQFNNIDVMKILLAHRADVNASDAEGCTALHFAVQRGSEAAVRLLLESHASVDVQNDMGITPLDMSRKMGLQPLIDLLSWYATIPPKEGLAMRKKKKKTTRRKQDAMNGGTGSVKDDQFVLPVPKRSCTYSPSPAYSTSSRGYDTSSIASWTSAGSSTSSNASSPWSLADSCHSSDYPSPSNTSPVNSVAWRMKTARPTLPPIIEKENQMVLSFDGHQSHSYAPKQLVAALPSSREPPLTPIDQHIGGSIFFSPESERVEITSPMSPSFDEDFLSAGGQVHSVPEELAPYFSTWQL